MILMKDPYISLFYLNLIYKYNIHHFQFKNEKYR